MIKKKLTEKKLVCHNKNKKPRRFKRIYSLINKDLCSNKFSLIIFI